MAKTGAQLIALERTLLSTASADAGKVGNDELYSYSTDAQTEIAALLPVRMLGSLATTSGATSLTGSSNNPYLSKPANVLRLTDVFVQRTSGGVMYPVQPLENMTSLQRHRNTQLYSGSGEQSDFYAEFGPYTYFYPTYSSTVYIHYFYVKVPTAVSSAANLDIPDHLYEWVAYRAVATALMKLGEFDAAQNFYRSLAGKMQSFRDIWGVEPPLPFVSQSSKPAAQQQG